MRLSLLMLFTLMLSAVNAMAEDFEHDGWPGEGIPGFSVKNTSLQLYKEPSKKSEVITVPVETGENILKADFVESSTLKTRLTYDKSEVITKKSVTWVARMAVTNTFCQGMPIPAIGRQPVIQPSEKNRNAAI